MSSLARDGLVLGVCLLSMVVFSAGDFEQPQFLEQGNLQQYSLLDSLQQPALPIYSTLPVAEELSFENTNEAEDRTPDGNYVWIKHFLKKKRNKFKRLKRRKFNNCHLPQPIFIGRRSDENAEVPYGYSGEYFPNHEQVQSLRPRRPWQQTSWRWAPEGIPTKEYIPREPLPGVLYNPPVLPKIQKNYGSRNYYADTKPTTNFVRTTDNFAPTRMQVKPPFKVTTQYPQYLLQDYTRDSSNENSTNNVYSREVLPNSAQFHRLGSNRSKFHAKKPSSLDITNENGVVTVTPTVTWVANPSELSSENEIATTSQSPWMPFQPQQSRNRFKIVVDPEPEIITARHPPELPLLIAKEPNMLHTKRYNSTSNIFSSTLTSPKTGID